MVLGLDEEVLEEPEIPVFGFCRHVHPTEEGRYSEFDRWWLSGGRRDTIAALKVGDCISRVAGRTA
jgi:hypothetical protein